MRLSPLILLALTALPPAIAGCATVGPPPVVPPRRELPATTLVTCPLTTLGPNPSIADLEAGYYSRGAEVLNCDTQRQLAVDTHVGEHADEDAWVKARPR